MTSRVGAILGTFVFFWIAPGTAAGLVPYLISRWRVQPALFGIPGVRWVGAVMAGIGLVAVVECFARFALRGRGTPAPIAPPEKLVISGLYRYVRNPMYVAVLSIIVGQALLLGSVLLLLQYAGVAWLVFHLFVVAYEEPTLRRQFGSSYETYRANVGRWWPRLTPWAGPVGT